MAERSVKPARPAYHLTLFPDFSSTIGIGEVFQFRLFSFSRIRVLEIVALHAMRFCRGESEAPPRSRLDFPETLPPRPAAFLSGLKGWKDPVNRSSFFGSGTALCFALSPRALETRV